MYLYTKSELIKYSSNDWVKHWLEANQTDLDLEVISHQWMLDSLPKRFIFASLYQDLLLENGNNRRMVLDVGGAYTSISKRLSKNHAYDLLDIMAHDTEGRVKKILEKEQCHLVHQDWASFKISKIYDLIIANDLFPNVDQRLKQFIEKYLPYCKEMRLSLTWYDHERNYAVKRIDGEEVFHVLAWKGKQIKEVLQSFQDSIKSPDFTVFESSDQSSLFENGRKVCFVQLKGNG